VDTFEALIAERPYRPAYARARALHILQAQSGRLFDGVVTDTLEGIARGQL
jgi:HD-GYP domain-containing protein (c-di-GMP phosphodiesterase class II)